MSSEELWYHISDRTYATGTNNSFLTSAVQAHERTRDKIRTALAELNGLDSAPLDPYERECLDAAINALLEAL